MTNNNSVEADGAQALMRRAQAARERAYAPYSRFLVGAAVQARDGRVFEGCNIENGAYPMCNCAERTAIFTAVATGLRKGDFAALAVTGDTPGPIAPCGACRQVMSEFFDPDMPVWLGNLQGALQRTSVRELLPGHFELTPPATD